MANENNKIKLLLLWDILKEHQSRIKVNRKKQVSFAETSAMFLCDKAYSFTEFVNPKSEKRQNQIFHSTNVLEKIKLIILERQSAHIYCEKFFKIL